MGNACTQIYTSPKPNPKNPLINQCTTQEIFTPSGRELRPAVGETVDAEYFCAQLDRNGADFRASDNVNGVNVQNGYCNNIGDAYEAEGDTPETANINTEWTVYTGPDNSSNFTCSYMALNPGFTVGAPNADLCCNGNCSINGSGLKCQRQVFLGDPVPCCFSDYACNQTDENKCFQTPERQRTCPPLFRNLNSQNCRDVIYDYCVGTSTFPTQSSWLEMWLENSFVEVNSNMIFDNRVVRSGPYNDSALISDRGKKYPQPEKQPCLRAIARSLTTEQVCSWEDLDGADVIQTNIQTDGFAWSKKVINEVFLKYSKESGGFLSGINTDGYNRSAGFYNTMWNICNKVPGLCSEAITEMCSEFKSAEQLVNNPEAIRWCACYSPDEIYAKYEQFDVSKECSPICNRAGVIPLVNSSLEKEICTQNICVIDDANINLSNSEVGAGGINFNQLCNSCGNSNISNVFSTGGNVTGTSTLTQSSIGVPYSMIQEPVYAANSNEYTFVFGNNYPISISQNEENYFVAIPLVSEVIDDITKNFGIQFIANPNSSETPGYLNISQSDISPNSPFVTYLGSSSSPLGIGSVKVNYGKQYMDSFGELQTPAGEGYPVGIGSVGSLFPNAALTNSSNLGFFTQGTYIQISVFINFSNEGYSVYGSGKDTAVAKLELNITPQYPPVNLSANIFGKANETVSSNRCSCIMQNNTLYSLNSKIGNVNFNQNCGTTTCTNSENEEISCGGKSNETNSIVTNFNTLSDQYTQEQVRDKYDKTFYIILMVIAMVFAILFLNFFFQKLERSVTKIKKFTSKIRD